MGWLVTLLGAVVSRSFALLYGVVAYKWAKFYAITAASIVVMAGLTLAMGLAIKAAILSARVYMPQSLGMATYFLPGDINVIISVFVTLRLTHFLWQWTNKQVGMFTQTVHM